MDLEEDFYATAKATAAALKSRGARTTSVTSDDGRTVIGWPVPGTSTSYGPHGKGSPGKGWWVETWGNGHVILDAQGQLWDYSFSGEEGSDVEKTLSHRIVRTSKHVLVGSTGKPFSKMKATLERMPYLSD